MINLKNKHIVVIGAARSGIAAAKLLQKKGADVFVSDNQSIAKNYRSKLIKSGISFEESGHTEKAEKGDFAVISPGVPTQSPLVQKYLKAGKEVVSEIEAASWFNKEPIVAVTGSNGKTTVTNWLDHIWNTAKKSHITAGNVGSAFSARVEENYETAILEISSFQLDHIENFHPHISLLLNITADHLDRYDNKLENYVESKFNITKNQYADDWFIYNYDDPIIKSRLSKLKKKAQGRSYWHFRQAKKCRKELSFEIKKSLLN